MDTDYHRKEHLFQKMNHMILSPRQVSMEALSEEIQDHILHHMVLGMEKEMEMVEDMNMVMDLELEKYKEIEDTG